MNIKHLHRLEMFIVASSSSSQALELMLSAATECLHIDLRPFSLEDEDENDPFECEGNTVSTATSQCSDWVLYFYVSALILTSFW